MPDILFRRIACLETTDGAGDDDCAVYFQGERLFREQMGKGSNRPIGDGSVLRHFEGGKTIYVKEIDESSGDDIIGTIFVSGAGDGEFRGDLHGDGSHYRLYYAVGGAP
ncbi:hypothetical protein ACH4MW_00030 [Streptomyces luteogriseus]|uniref:hypothetical protein n=1 Tax=Streptomyces luteogriseus TaxID=68233 RepID=UPI00378D0D9D